uniref:GspH/FimT family pseudopilin n=1 Tax=Marinobacterium profundum TaxID=1714300 RepID=UPI00082F3D9C|nr:GspH/FimT family protein [Marinobacterium profundum]
MACEISGRRTVMLGYQTGVTLVELLVTLVVLAIFALVGFPSLTSMFESYRVAGAAQTLYADLQYARAESIKRNLDVAVNFDSTAWCYGITDTAPFTACDCSGTVASQASCSVNGEQYIVSGDSFPGVSMASSLSSGSVTFDPTRGTLSPSGNVRFLGDATEEVRVTAYFIGRVRLCSPTGYAGYKSC